jgi:hypothetical protein
MNQFIKVACFLLMVSSVYGSFKQQISRKIFKTSASLALGLQIGLGLPQSNFAAEIGPNDIQCTFKLSEKSKATQKYEQG